MPPAHVCAWLRSSHPLVFGHRGARGLAPENTLAAFDRGVAEGADGLELDVRLSQDGVPVVIHDADLTRTAGLAVPVSTLTAAELARVDAGFHFAPAQGHPWRGKGLGVPTLGEVLRRYPVTPLIVDLKANSEALAHAAVDEILRADAVTRVCLGSFGFGALTAARRKAPQLATGASQKEVAWALFRSRVRWPLTDARHHGYFVPERRKGLIIVTPRFVRDAHDAGLVVQVWAVNTEADVRRLLEWGVRGILTDRPDITVPAVRAWSRR